MGTFVFLGRRFVSLERVRLIPPWLAACVWRDASLPSCGPWVPARLPACLRAQVCNNLVLGISMTAVSEAMNIGVKLGVDPVKLAVRQSVRPRVHTNACVHTNATNACMFPSTRAYECMRCV